mmetsp:Transcript_34613/g.55323  ORF Transcript_34613/g.55323 Transcript_34613/m.55323 type:complete len:236 (-) Transcript_34613:171-878(-)
MMHIDLAWYFLDVHGQEQGPVRGSKLRQWIQRGSISQDFRVRLFNWDGYSSVQELWPNCEVAFLLPPDIYGSSGSLRWGGYKHNQGQIVVERHAVKLEQFVETADKADAAEKAEKSAEKATPSKDSKETQAQAAGTAKSDVEREIASILAACPVLHRTDFDPMVRQHLHAFHGLGGAPQVREALEEVRVVIIGRPRETVKSWPAYLYKLLKNAFLKAKAARYDKAGAKRLENHKR